MVSALRSAVSNRSSRPALGKVEAGAFGRGHHDPVRRQDVSSGLTDRADHSDIRLGRHAAAGRDQHIDQPRWVLLEVPTTRQPLRRQ